MTAKRGHVNQYGEWVISPQYKYVNEFSDNGIALVFNEILINEKEVAIWPNPPFYCGYINTKGEVVIPFEYYALSLKDTVQEFRENCGVIELYKEGYTHYFNTEGTLLGKKPELIDVYYEGESYPINLAKYYDTKKAEPVSTN